MGAALVGVDGVGEGVHRLRISAVPLHRDFDLVAGALAVEVDDALLDRALGAVDVLDEVDQAAGVVERAVLDLVRCHRFGRLFFGGLGRFGGVADDFVDDLVLVTRSSVRLMVNPLFRKAISCSRRATVSKSYSVVSKMSGSAQNLIVVPVFLVASPCLRVPGTAWS